MAAPPGASYRYEVGFTFPPGLERDDLVQHQLELRMLLPHVSGLRHYSQFKMPRLPSPGRQAQRPTLLAQ
jgi:hypothetical protein